MPRAATCGDHGGILVRFAWSEVSWLFPLVGGLSKVNYIIYLVLLEEGDGGVNSEEVEDARYAVLYFHRAFKSYSGSSA